MGFLLVARLIILKKDNLLAFGVTTLFLGLTVWFSLYYIKHTTERKKFSFSYICLYITILMFLFFFDYFILHLMESPLLVNGKANLFSYKYHLINDLSDAVFNSKTFSIMHFIAFTLTIMSLNYFFSSVLYNKNKLNEECISGINIIVKIISGILVYWILYGLIKIFL